MEMYIYGLSKVEVILFQQEKIKSQDNFIKGTKVT
jgi:lipopolysaccharide export system protein LptA